MQQLWADIVCVRPKSTVRTSATACTNCCTTPPLYSIDATLQSSVYVLECPSGQDIAIFIILPRALTHTCAAALVILE
jgi:hypothetical protein